MELVQRVLTNLEERRQRVLRGEINCIPSPFNTFTSDFPGIEQGKYYCVSAASKGGKSQLSNYLFLYTPILYAYHHPEQLRTQIFYFPLEETPEKITMRFMCFLLYTMSQGKIRVSPMRLQSTVYREAVDKSILDLLNSLEYQSILNFYQDHVHFISERNPTSAWKTITNYAREAGTIHRKKILIENKETGVKQEKEVFDFYEPKDPDEYVIILWDHQSLTALEKEKETGRGMNLKECIDKLSEYFMIFRNHYNYIPVMIAQQNSETISLDAFKSNKIRPTLAGIADSKNVGKDCSVMLGITNPFAFELPEYLGYDIRKLKGYARFLEVVLNREGESNGVLPLYFDGATNFFKPLPPANDVVNLSKVYQMVRDNTSK